MEKEELHVWRAAVGKCSLCNHLDKDRIRQAPWTGAKSRRKVWWSTEYVNHLRLHRLFISYNQEKNRNFREEKSNSTLTRWSKLTSPRWTDRHHEFPGVTPWEGDHVTYAVSWSRIYNLNLKMRKPQINLQKKIILWTQRGEGLNSSKMSIS